MMKRKHLDLILTQPTQLGVATVALMVAVTQQIPAGVIPVEATALEPTVQTVVVIQQIALEVILVEAMGPGVTVRIAAEVEVTLLGGATETEVTPIILGVIQQVVCDVQESVSCLLVMSVS